MILFRSDYVKYSTAIIDYDTSNESFLQLAAKYHEAGYENSLFLLTLLNPALQGIDPFSDDLTLEQKVAISTEAEKNPWYFLREICRLPPSAGLEPLRYKAHRGNIAATWTFLNNIDFILVQPRQTGKSVGIDCIMVWLLYLSTNNLKISMITKDAALRTANVERLQMIRDLLPKYLFELDKKDTSNKLGLTYNVNNNRYTTSVAQMSEAAATNVGRGQTSPVFHIDEAPFISHIATTMTAALAGGTAAKEYAASIGAPNCTIITTTAGKKDDRDGKHVYNMVEEAATWKEAYFDLKDNDDLHNVIYKSTTGIYKRIYMEFSHTQLGYTDEWLLKALAASGAKGEEADRDFFNRWTSGSLESPLTVEQNMTVQESKRPVAHTEVTPQGYTVNWYMDKPILENYLRKNNVIMSMDTSDAVGKDDIGVVFQDIHTLEVIGATTINETMIPTFANWAADTIIKYTNILLMVERKSTGSTILDIIIARLLAAGMNPFKRIYNTVVQEYASRGVEWDEVSRASANNGVSTRMMVKYRKYFGFVTTSSSRHDLYGNVLQNLVKLGGTRINDSKLIGQITSLVVRGGRIDHKASGHDDLVIAYLLCGWTLMNGLNLRFYGVNPLDVMSRVKQKTAVATIEEEYASELEAKMREDIESLKVELINVRDVNRRMLLSGKLARLVDKASGILSENLSFDAMLNDIEAQSSRTARSRYRKVA